MIPFVEFPKIARLSREIVITEKIDGTNAQIHVTEAGEVLAGSRTRWITPEADNFGFATWVQAHRVELLSLGPGSHFGEWWGSGIQRGYGLAERRFSLFNVNRWGLGGTDADRLPPCCFVVPVLRRCEFLSEEIDEALDGLARYGSLASPGFLRPEGIVVYHTAARVRFKKTLARDEEPKSRIASGALR